MNWQDNVTLMARHIDAAVAKAKREGIVGMSRKNLRQIVSTQGVRVAPHAFDRLLDEAIRKADIPANWLYE